MIGRQQAVLTGWMLAAAVHLPLFNTVMHALVTFLVLRRYGMRGFWARDAKPVVLTQQKIDGIHLTGAQQCMMQSDSRALRRNAATVAAYALLACCAVAVGLQ